MTDSLHEAALIARLSAVFEPFLQSTRDALRIHEAQESKRVSNDEKSAIAKRLKYVKVLQANTAARTHFEQIGRLSHAQLNAGRGNQGSQAVSLRSHLELLKLRKANAELRVIEHHAHQLDQQSKEDGIFSLKNTQEVALTPKEAIASSSQADLDELKQKAVDLTSKLELAVLHAQHQQQQGKILLNKVKERSLAQHGDIAEKKNKFQAVSKTRDELVRWIEERIAVENPDVERSVRLPKSSGDSNGHQGDRVAELYDDYIRARTELLKISLAAISPLPSQSTKAASSESPHKTPSEPISQSSALLPFIENQLLCRVQRHDVNVLMHDFISSLVSSKNSRTLEGLERLSDESHLIHLASSSKHDLSAVSGAAGTSEATEAQRKKNEVLQRAEMWALADFEARNLSTRDIKSHVAEGNESTEGAESILAELVELLNQRRQRLDQLKEEWSAGSGILNNSKG